MGLQDLIDKVRDIQAVKPVDKERIREGIELLRKYKAGKSNLERRIIEDENFYKLQYRRNADKAESKPSTAWLLNSVINKHADLMDNYPEAVCLPREATDEEDAKVLSEIIPVIIEQNDYEQTYSDAIWYFIKHGAAAQGVFWDSSKNNGLGDISIKNVDLLNLFWEPGITRLSDSANLFYVSLADEEAMKERYPDLKSGGDVINLAEYVYDDSVDNTDKVLVIDWYYKKQLADGRTVLHYIKFCGDTVLFASENEAGYESGFYEHGEYPFTMAVMYPEAGTPVGFGIISVCRDPQQYIDTLDGLMLEYVYKIANPRFWCRKDAGVNQDDFLDWKKPIVEVEGTIDDEKLRQINLQPLGSAIQNLRQMKVDELKETSSNRDFSQGGTSSGVTSGAAIATLQEAGNKTSRDMIKSMYRSFVDIVRLSIELIRQFYDEEREFRVTNSAGGYEFMRYSNQSIREQDINGEYYRKPIFDIDVKAQKSNAFSKLSQNETAVNLYNMGVFAPENAQSALAMLEIMDFDGKEKVRQFVSEGMTLQNIINRQQEQLAALQGQLMGQRAVEAEMQVQGSTGGGEVVSSDNAQKRAAQLNNKSYADTLIKKAGGIT